MRDGAGHAGSRQGFSGDAAAVSGRPAVRSAGTRSALESALLILSAYRARIVAAFGVAAAGVVLGILLRELLYKYGDLGATTIVPLVAAAVVALGITLTVPALSIVGCVVIAFSSSSALLHEEYGLPLLIKYLPPMLLVALALDRVRRSRSPLVPQGLRLERRQPGVVTDAFRLCLTLLAVYLVFTLFPVLYASDATAALAELDLQRKNLLLCLALALSVGQFGRWSSFPFVCTIALYATSATVLLAAIGSFYPALEGMLPGFAKVYGSGEAGDTSERIAGAFAHPNTLGRYAVFMMPLAVCLAMVQDGIRRALALLCLLVLFAGVMLSESRGAILVLAIIALPALPFAARTAKVRHWLPALIACTVVTLAAWEHVDTERMTRSIEDVERFVADGGVPVDGATRGRLSEMRIAYELWRGHPLVGVGLANYEHYFQIYSYDFGTKLYNDDRSAHSLYLELLAERGIVGLLGFFVAIGGIVVTVLHHGVRILRAGARVEGALATAMVVSAVSYYLSAMLLHDVHSTPIWALTGVMIASTRQIAPPLRTGVASHGNIVRAREAR